MYKNHMVVVLKLVTVYNVLKINLKVQTEELVLICHCLRDYSCSYCTDNFVCWRLKKRLLEGANNFAAVSC